MKKALIVIDMLNDFVRLDGDLSVSGAETIIQTIDELRQRAYEKDIPVIYFNDSHNEDDPELKIWPLHCMKGTKGAEVVEELTPRKNDYVILKQENSAFTNPETLFLLRRLEIEEVYLTGVATDYCVRNFALYGNSAKGAIDYGIKVNIVVDAIKGVDEILGVPNTKGKVVYSALELGAAGVKPIYANQVLEDMIKN